MRKCVTHRKRQQVARKPNRSGLGLPVVGRCLPSDFLISPENSLAHFGWFSSEFIDQTHAGFGMAEFGLGEIGEQG